MSNVGVSGKLIVLNDPNDLAPKPLLILSLSNEPLSLSHLSLSKEEEYIEGPGIAIPPSSLSSSSNDLRPLPSTGLSRTTRGLAMGLGGGEYEGDKRDGE